jgi:N-hydroxyarylamine O-acetyltransferase
MTGAADAFDLGAYLSRIGHDGPREATPGVLEAVHRAHAVAIPFENLDVRLGRPIRLDLTSLQAKLVAGRRGGYCFEQNTLFAAALEALGFRVTRLAARVRLGATRLLPRTHMLLGVDVGGQAYLADVGFGGEGLLGPVPLTPGPPVRQGLWAYRVVEEACLRVLQSRRGDGWVDLYAFSLEPQDPIDFEVANHYTATHPDSVFVRSLTVQRPTPEARHILRNRDYLVESAAGTVSRRVADGELRRLLVGTFGLDVPAELLTAAAQGL